MALTETIIERSRHLQLIDWRNLWAYRDMFYFLVKRDLLAKYKQTVLGPAWFVIQPILMTLVFTVVFGQIAQLETDGVPQFLFYLCGITFWNLLNQNFLMASAVFIGNRGLFSKVYFPRLIIPLGGATSFLVNFALQSVVLLAFWIFYRVNPATAETIRVSVALPVVFLLVGQLVLLGIGVGFLFASLSTRYRDLQHLLAFFVQAWMYGTPIIYPFSEVPERAQWIIALNPASAIVENARHLILGTPVAPAGMVAVSVAMTLVIALAGLLVFNQTQRTIVDYA